MPHDQLHNDQATAVSVAAGVRVVPITDDDVRRVAEFLHAVDRRVSADAWTAAVNVPWEVEKPNAGFMLLDADDVVGVQLAFYSERMLSGTRERFCNLGAWYVSPGYRFHALRLLKAVLRQEGYHFTDLSPSGNVVGVNEKLSFRFLDTTTALVPNLPWPTLPRRDRISSDPALIERTVTGADLKLYRDHVATGAARHVVLIRGDEWCYVMFRRDRRKGLPLFASVLYVSNPALFRAMARPFARHLLLHHRALGTLAEERVVGCRPRPSLRLRSPRRKMFRSPNLAPAQIDYLYSELVCVSW
ncbi:MAG TPA: hypothetical protein VH834_19675 [Solirubrobacteraceae bacterium]